MFFVEFYFDILTSLYNDILTQSILHFNASKIHFHITILMGLEGCSYGDIWLHNYDKIDV